MKLKSFATLIKLARRDLDMRRKILAALQEKKELLEMAIKALDEECVREAAAATADFTLTTAFNIYRKRYVIKREGAVKEMQALEAQIEKARDEIHAAFTELKKLEISLENYLKKQKEKAEKLDAANMDEIAIRRHSSGTEDGE